MLTTENLKTYGADTAEGLARCLNDEGFYLDLVKTSFEDTKIDELSAALDKAEFDKAFDLAHALKGMYGNLALTPIYKPLNEVTDILRNRKVTDKDQLLSGCLPLVKEAQEQKRKLMQL